MTQEQKERIVIIRSHLDFVQQSITKLDEKLDKMVAPYESAITLLCTTPGVDRTSAINIISEIGTDMSQFTNSKRLCCWCWLYLVKSARVNGKPCMSTRNILVLRRYRQGGSYKIS